MALTDSEEQVAAVAERLNGEETSSPLTGLLTTTPANAGTEPIRKRTGEEASF